MLIYFMQEQLKNLFGFFIKHLKFFCNQGNVKAYEENTTKVDAMNEDDKSESDKRFRKQEEMSKTPEKEQILCIVRSTRNKKVPATLRD
jgi:hypothetical protein